MNFNPLGTDFHIKQIEGCLPSLKIDYNTMLRGDTQRLYGDYQTVKHSVNKIEGDVSGISPHIRNYFDLYKEDVSKITDKQFVEAYETLTASGDKSLLCHFSRLEIEEIADSKGIELKGAEETLLDAYRSRCRLTINLPPTDCIVQLKDQFHYHLNVTDFRTDKASGSRQIKSNGRWIVAEPLHDNLVTTLIAHYALINTSSDKPYKSEAVNMAYQSLFIDNQVHVVPDYLLSLPKWDGRNRIGELAECLKSTDEYKVEVMDLKGNVRPYKEHVLFHWFRNSVARAMYPLSNGLDTRYRKTPDNILPILAGGQNIGKSTFIYYIASDISQHCPGTTGEVDLNGNLKDKDTTMNLQRLYVGETPECDGLNHKETSTLKQLLTAAVLDCRHPYNRSITSVAPQFNLIGTCNLALNTHLLGDDTGSRRQAIIEIYDIDKSYGDIDIRQLWAQAVDLFLEADNFDYDPEVRRVAEELNLNFTSNEYSPILTSYYEFDLKDIEIVHVRDVISSIGNIVANINAHQFTRITKALKFCGAICLGDVDEIQARSLGYESVKSMMEKIGATGDLYSKFIGLRSVGENPL